MSHIIVQQTGRAGILTLYRPKALNAVDHSMVKDLLAALDAFEKEPAVEVIVLRSASDRVFCTGRDKGDIRDFHVSGAFERAEAFFTDEYYLVDRIVHCSKPCVSLIDGICLGSGLGLSIQCDYRVATERSMFAMPGTTIGFIPTVGSSYILPRLPWGAGRWLGLTGAHVNGGDALSLGLVTHLTAPRILPALLDALIATHESLETLFGRFSWSYNSSNRIGWLAEMGKLFSGPCLNSIKDRLKSQNSTYAKNALRELCDVPVRSLFETLVLLDRGVSSSLEECLAYELEIIRCAIRHPALIEQENSQFFANGN